MLDGRNFWYVGVDAILPDLAIPHTGGNLTGARIDAMVLLNPAMIQKAFSRWQVSEGIIGEDRPVTLLQGGDQGQTPVRLYFDESGLLVRLVRWNDMALGPVPLQFDFFDYRNIDGIRRPTRWVKTATNNRVTFRLKDVRLNVAVEAARFTKPAPVALR